MSVSINGNGTVLGVTGVIPSSASTYLAAGAGAVLTSVEDKLQELVYAEDFKLPTDPDDTLSIQRGLNLGAAVGLRSGKTYIAYGLQAVAGAALVCPYGRAYITVPAGVSRYGILINVNDFTLSGVDFAGGNLGPYKSSAGTVGTRYGVIIGNVLGTNINLKGIKVSDCDLYGFDGAGLLGREIVVGYDFGYKCTLHNVNAYSNCVGLWFSSRFEYVTATSCYGYECYAGIIMAAGNNSIVASHFEHNFQNCQLTTDPNNAHGQFVGCSFNHSGAVTGVLGGYGLYASAITAGESFTSCAFWYAPIALVNCDGIQIRNSQIVSSAVTITGGGLNSIDDNWIRDPFVPTLVGNTFTSFRRNRTNTADNSPQAYYPDLYATTTSSYAYAFPIGLNSATYFEIPLAYSPQIWVGNTGTFISSSAPGRAYLPRSGLFTIDAAFTFTTNTTNQTIGLAVVRYSYASGWTVQSESVEEVRQINLSGTAGVTIRLSITMMCVNADAISIQAKTSAGIASITALDVRIRSVD
jgi:hypothetical protein